MHTNDKYRRTKITLCIPDPFTVMVGSGNNTIAASVMALGAQCIATVQLLSHIIIIMTTLTVQLPYHVLD